MKNKAKERKQRRVGEPVKEITQTKKGRPSDRSQRFVNGFIASLPGSFCSII
uniref:Uncharacterized protein n=1 Tax=Nelumbo nucifera TaxID=4432 RepID=A0A823A0I4_NELNU|nr:TPA_asm: hypothetical protein HUJ06_018493 [Nelumbo nucifera]